MRYYQEDIEDLRDRFEYTKDEVDSFRIMSNPTGPLKGDCDDFAITALWIAEGKSMVRFWWAILTFRAVIWRVKGREGWMPNHAVLWHSKHGWIDNQNPEWSETRHHTLRWPRTFPMIALKMLIGKIKGP